MRTPCTVVHNKAVKTLSNHLCGVYLMCHLNVERRQAQVAIQAPVTEFHQERSANSEIKAGMPRREESVGLERHNHSLAIPVIPVPAQ